VKAHKAFNDGALTLQSLRPGNSIIARFAEITDRNAAEAARGTELTVPRAALPPIAEGEYYHADLIAIEDFGAGDVIEIERPDGKRFMVPMTAEAVPEWGEKIVIDALYVV
jgi:16S rRNA processing protein RimM